jgi:8-oxo-dGTP pyrophosphatase MutT (NUDIX family)
MEHNTVSAMGVLFHCSTTARYLYLLRNDPKNPATWGLPGGKSLPGENFINTVTRECTEELGCMPPYTQIVPLEKFTSPDERFVYHTFWCQVAREFVPVLNHEHLGYAWIDSGTLPRPLHPGLWNTVNFDVIQQKIQLVESINR